MITVKEALSLIESTARYFESHKIPLFNSIGHVLRENWFTDRPLPPYDRITMDGIAIHFEWFNNDHRTFKIQGIAAAGKAKMTLQDPLKCIEVMTGSILPEGCDTVIRYEDVSIKDNLATINIDTIRFQQNVHFIGSDQNLGDQIVHKNTRLSAAEIGIGASIGKTEVRVAKMPKVMVISTGDELVPIHTTPLDHQIRRSNVHQLVAALTGQNIYADTDHLQDDKEIIKNKLANYLNNYDAIILSGGVSKGKFDFLPEVLEDLGVTKLFHKIKQRPGKPFWFGQYKNEESHSCTLFALPGNPNSSFLCLHKYFNYWLSLCLTGDPPINEQAMLTEDIHFNKELVLFQEVHLSQNNQGQLQAKPIRGNGSGDLSNLVNADAFIELPKEKEVFKKGECYPIIRYR